MSDSSSASTVYARIPTMNQLPRFLGMQGQFNHHQNTQPSVTVPTITPSSTSAISGSSGSTIEPCSSPCAPKSNHSILTSRSMTTLQSLSGPNLLSDQRLGPSSRTQPPPSHRKPSELRQESHSLLSSLTAAQEGHEATIFDLRFEDRRRIAALIADLANAQEQVELLESKIDAEGNKFRKEYERQVELIKQLTQRCEILSAHPPPNTNSRTSILEQELNHLAKENKALREKLANLEKANTGLRLNLQDLEKKYEKSNEDNKRLKWILKTIQQREEILLQNKCHASSNENHGSGGGCHDETDSPSNIVVLKEGKNESVASSQPPYYGNEGANQARRSDCSNSTVTTNDGTNYHRQPPSGGDFHEFPVYEPHLVIPPMNSPVIMKIPRSPVAGGVSSHRPQMSHSDPHPRQFNPNNNNRVNPTRSNPEERCNPTAPPTVTTDPNEEEILRELFFTF